MKKKEDNDEKSKNEFSLNQKEVHLFGELLLKRINNRWEGLLEDTDHVWGLHEELELLKKLTTIVVRLQNGRILEEI